MKKTLRTLCRLRDWSVKDAQRSLAEARQHSDQLRKRADALEQEVAAEQACARLDPTVAGLAYANFAARARARRADLEEAERLAAEAETQQRLLLTAAHQERRKVEILAETQEQQDAKDAEKAEQKLLDEIATQNHASRRTNGHH